MPPHPVRPDLPRPPAAGSRKPRAPFWTPWLCAPLFAGLPIAGCGLAASVVDPPRATSGVSLDRERTPPAMLAGRQPPVVPIGAVVPVRTVVR
jgi:hypothetical protein